MFFENTVNLSNILTVRKHILYDLEKGTYKFTGQEKYTHDSNGFYAVWDGKLYDLADIYKKGYAFIAENEVYYLNEHEYDFSHEYAGNKKFRFTAVIDGKEVVNVKYPEPPADCNIYGIEDDLDFGHWVTGLFQK